MWGACRSHHEKLVIVDHHICFLGGLDLCFGRYDTNEHKVSDYPPFIWPGKDYYNPRLIMHFHLSDPSIRCFFFSKQVNFGTDSMRIEFLW